MLRSITVLTTVIGITFAASSAQADEPRSTAFIVSASDFETTKARAVLDRRVRNAAEEVCGVNAAAEGESWGQVKVCQAKVREDIYRQIAAAKLSDGIRLTAR